MTKKKRICRLIEYYMNDVKGSAVEEMYGKGSKIQIKNIFYSNSQSSIMIEAIIVLGEVINEEVMDRALADILIQDALVYFYPNHSVKAYVQFDA